MSDPEFDRLDPELQQLLQRLKDVPERLPGLASQSRSNYLAMAHRMAAERRTADQLQPTIGSETLSRRFNEWIGSIIHPLRGVPQFSLVRIFLTLAVVLGLIFGSMAGAVSAAQGSQPGQVLYPFKIVSEDVRLKMASTPEAKFELALALSIRRTLEIGALIQEDKPVPPAVASRLESHIMLAFDLSTALDENGQTEALLQLQAQLRDQERIIGPVQANGPGSTDLVLRQIRQQIQNQLRLIDAGLEDPHQFKQRLQQREQYPEDELPNDLATEEPGSQDGNKGPGPGPNDQPGEGQIGPTNPAGTPPASDSYGPGPATCDPQKGCEPGNDGGGSGSGSGSEGGPIHPDPGNSASGGSQTQAPTSAPAGGSGTGGNKP